MKKNFFLAVFFFLCGLVFVKAQDLIAFRDGSVIETKIIETTPNQIKYKRFDYLDGPTLIIPLADILSIRYENGILDIRNPYPPEKQESPIIDKKSPKKKSEKTNFGLNANAGGLIPLGETLTASGPSVNFEFIKNNFYSIVNLNIPIEDTVGFGFLGIFIYLWKSKIGDFYLGGGVGYTYHSDHFFTFGASAGYRYVTSFGMYFGAGAYIGGKINDGIKLDIRPNLGIGYVFN